MIRIVCVSFNANLGFLINIKMNFIISKWLLVILSIQRAISQYHKIIRMNVSTLNSWYDPLQICLITNSTSSHTPLSKILEECRNDIHNSRYPDGFASLPSHNNKKPGTCCTDELPIRDRGFDDVIEGYEDGNMNRALMLLYQLSATNRSVMFMGDSMNTQIYNAFLAEIGRGMNGGGSIDLDYFEKLWWSARYNEIGLTARCRSYLPNLAKWIPPIGSSYSNPVYIYNVNMYAFSMGHTEEAMLTRILLPFLSTHEHPAGLLILANIGHHLTSERSNTDHTIINARVGAFLTWLNDIAIVNPNNVPAFRETSPSHFNSPDLDGSFEKWHASVHSQYDYLAVNKWDQTLYHCRQIHNLSNPDASQTPENHAARKILKAWGNESLVLLLPVFEYLAPFYKLKYGHCGGPNRVSKLDCVHFCSNSPPMWAPIWAEILNLTRNFKPPLIKSKVKSWEKLNPWQDAKVAMEALPSTGTDEDQVVSMLSSLAFEPHVFLIMNGLKYPVESVGAAQQLVNRTITKQDVLNMTTLELDEMLSGAFVKAPKIWPDGTLVRLGSGREFFLVLNNEKHSIPNWDTFQFLKLDANKVVGLDEAEFDAIKTGEPVPPCTNCRRLLRRHRSRNRRQ